MPPSFPLSLWKKSWLREICIFPSFRQNEGRCVYFFSIIIPGWHQTGQLHAGRGHRIEVASGEEAVNSLLTPRLRLPETLAQNPHMKAKPVMTNKLGPATQRWNLQMCSLSASRHKSRCGVQIELHYSFARQRHGSLFIGAGRGRRTKDPLYEVCAVHGEQMLGKVSFTHFSASLSPLSVSKLLRFQPFCSSLHCTPA